LIKGQLLSWEDYWQHARSLGTEYAEAQSQHSENESVCIAYQDKKFFVGAGHFQFVAQRSVLQQVTPIPSKRLYGGDRFLDKMLNDQGYLRLSTPAWWIQHLGNSLEEFDEITPKGRGSIKKRGGQKSLLGWLLKIKLLRAIVWKLYHWLFELLNRAER